MEINSLSHGFRLLTKERLAEVQADACLFEHMQSGARLYHLACADDNKVFAIAFPTPPCDDSGVAHILEHSALCGSAKYPLKEPFVDLVKGSLNTFLNAMTYPDKTVYPVASRNAQDFRNLMDVYLDAVFYPLIYENPYTLRQEGWHYELEDAAGELSYNGVVYNEMKGVYSTPDAYLQRAVFGALFPDSCYRFESGGHPDAIPGLTSEAFLKFHQRHYRPENAFLYLYGDVDLAATLAYLDSAYLGKFTKSGAPLPRVELQKPLARTKLVEAAYPVASGTDCTAKTYHELAIVTGQARDIETLMALRLLENVLLESEAGPLRRALLASGVGQNISGSFTGSLLQPIFAIRAAASEASERDRFLSVIYRTLQELTIKGIDKELLEAALNYLEFKLREADFGTYPKGLIYGLSVYDSWLYGADPGAALCYNRYLEKMRAGLATRYFENLIETYLLDNSHKALVTLVPAPGMEEAASAKLAQELAAVKAKLTPAKLAEIAGDCARLHQRQAEPDSEAARATIPSLKRSDIRREIETFALERTSEGGGPWLYLEQATNQIVYADFAFDMSGVPERLLPYCYLLRDCLGKLDTAAYTYQELATVLAKETGGVTFSLRAHTAAENADEYRIYFHLRAKALVTKLPQLFRLLTNIAAHTRFTDLERFQELVEELKSDWDDNFFARGQTVAVSRLISYISASGRVAEYDNFSYYCFLKELTANFASAGAQCLKELAQLAPLILQQAQYVFAYSCEKAAQPLVAAAARAFLAGLPLAAFAGKACELQVAALNEGISTAGKVQYVVAGGSFLKHGYRFTGAMRVLETLLRYEYLWTKIRIQGGAYGAQARFDLNGLVIFASYRDPELAATLAAYRALPAWLHELELGERELTKYVIGTISAMDTPLTNYLRLEAALNQYLSGLTDARRQKIRDEVLGVTCGDLKALAPMLSAVFSDGHLCVVGAKEQLEKERSLFGAIIDS